MATENGHEYIQWNVNHDEWWIEGDFTIYFFIINPLEIRFYTSNVGAVGAVSTWV